MIKTTLARVRLELADRLFTLEVQIPDGHGFTWPSMEPCIYEVLL